MRARASGVHASCTCVTRSMTAASARIASAPRRTSASSRPSNSTISTALGVPTIQSSNGASVGLRRPNTNRPSSINSTADGPWALTCGTASSAAWRVSNCSIASIRSVGTGRTRTVTSTIIARVPSDPAINFARLNGASPVNASRLYPPTRRMTFGKRASISSSRSRVRRRTVR